MSTGARFLSQMLARSMQAIADWFDQHEQVRFWLGVLRLGLFQFGMGLSLAPITGTLNRVLIDELAIPAVAVGSLIAIHYFVSPVRALIGFHTDQRRAEGQWRLPYTVLGAMMTYGGLACVPFSLILLGGNGSLSFWPALFVCVLIFLVYGIGVNMVETTYLATVSDITPPKERGRVLAVLWTLLVLGTVVGSLIIGSLLVEYSHVQLIRVMQGSAVTFIFLTFVSLWNKERLRPDGIIDAPLDTVRVRTSLGESLRMLAGQSSLRKLFIVLFVATTAFATHDVLLEPYGGQVLDMSVSATTQLTAWWGAAMFVSIIMAGWMLWRKFSPIVPIYLGCAIGALGFLVVGYAGPDRLVNTFRAGVWMIGMGRGMFIVASIALVMMLADRNHTGLFLGLWGIMQALAQGFGTIGGGLARDIAQQQSGNVLFGYTMVYNASLGALVVAILLVLAFRLGRQLRSGAMRSPWADLQNLPADQMIT
ncbi:MAG: BCD family MFS transporter [Chloroflexi bacterium AL-W]|nr:BCD family MFS transporter [Chloroflexi bacterium AL-N1]NOK71628.1 BCD family MFS transporter [Chloroflexi bacterium AL-N10]NOK78928.1 BCD family MFS transporter [Chloroflexi bacterium AL-N5]NOK86403.1 BCD family MFS transporter [Chloroflexi bacterium AL-W]